MVEMSGNILVMVRFWDDFSMYHWGSCSRLETIWSASKWKKRGWSVVRFWTHLYHVRVGNLDAKYHSAPIQFSSKWAKFFIIYIIESSIIFSGCLENGNQYVPTVESFRYFYWLWNTPENLTFFNFDVYSNSESDRSLNITEGKASWYNRIFSFWFGNSAKDPLVKDRRMNKNNTMTNFPDILAPKKKNKNFALREYRKI